MKCVQLEKSQFSPVEGLKRYKVDFSFITYVLSNLLKE